MVLTKYYKYHKQDHKCQQNILFIRPRPFLCHVHISYILPTKSKASALKKEIYSKKQLRNTSMGHLQILCVFFCASRSYCQSLFSSMLVLIQRTKTQLLLSLNDKSRGITHVQFNRKRFFNVMQITKHFLAIKLHQYIVIPRRQLQKVSF